MQKSNPSTKVRQTSLCSCASWKAKYLLGSVLFLIPLLARYSYTTCKACFPWYLAPPSIYDTRIFHGKQNPINVHRFVFSYKLNLLEAKPEELSPTELLLQQNVFDTISAYTEANNQKNTAKETTVAFYDNSACLDIILYGNVLSIPLSIELANYFMKERKGMYKSDICRLFALYELGGIYFDNDLKVREPMTLHLDKNTSFSTSISAKRKDFFQAYLAVGPKHPVILLAIYYTLQFYRRERLVKNHLIGTSLLHDAFVDYYKINLAVTDNLLPPGLSKADEQLTHLLYEVKMTPALLESNGTRDLFHGVELQSTIKRKDACNYVVVDPVSKTVPFYSRVKGVPKCT